jgi:hypothetical protein
MRTLVLLFPLAAGCAGASSAAGSCTDAATLDDGVVAATVDSAPWESTATWLWQGGSLQLTAAPADGWNFTFVAQTLDGGDTVKDVVESGAFPVELTLESGADGWAIAYPTDGDSYSTNAGNGTLTVTDFADDVLSACFAFTAATDGGDTVNVEAGAARATPFSAG